MRRLANRLAVARLSASAQGAPASLPMEATGRFVAEAPAVEPHAPPTADSMPPLPAPADAAPPVEAGPAAAASSPTAPEASPTGASRPARVRRTLLQSHERRTASPPTPVPSSAEPEDTDRTATAPIASRRQSLPPVEPPRSHAHRYFAQLPWAGRQAGRMEAPPVPAGWSAPPQKTAGAFFQALPWGAPIADRQGPEDNARGGFLAFATRAVLRASGADPALHDPSAPPRAHTYFASLPWNGATP